MKCPTCGKASDVTDSRPSGGMVRRRRRCLNDHRFTTWESCARPERYPAEVVRAARRAADEAEAVRKLIAPARKGRRTGQTDAVEGVK